VSSWKTTVGFYWWLIIPLIGTLLGHTFGFFFGLGLDVLIWIFMIMYTTLAEKEEPPVLKIVASAQKSSPKVYNSIYRVLVPPAEPRWVCTGCRISVGDYGWDTDLHPENGLIHLTGYARDWKTIWYADFKPHEVEYVGPKPGVDSRDGPNPYPTAG
jgi:hypothetical protein